MQQRNRFALLLTALFIVSLSSCLYAQSSTRGRSTEPGQSSTEGRSRTRASHELSVRSNIRGASVYLDGEFIGRTPLTTRVPAGTYELEVTADGFGDFRTRLTIDQNTTVNAFLEQQEVSVTIEIPDRYISDRRRGDSELRIYVDGRRMNSLRFSLPAGSHTFRLESGVFSFEEQVNLRPGRRYVIVPRLELDIR